MVELKASLPTETLDQTIGNCRLQGFDPGAVWSIASYPGRDPKVGGMGLPAPGQILPMGMGRLVWTGRQQAFLMGEMLPEGLDAAVTDQADAWAWVRLSGADTVAVLARVCPLDLREAAFPVNTSARSLLAHMSAIYIRTGVQSFEIAVFRSMAHTLQHDLTQAMRNVAARQ